MTVILSSHIPNAMIATKLLHVVVVHDELKS